MRTIDTDLVAKAEIFVIDLFQKTLPEGYLFHSTKHTLTVKNNALFIGRKSGLTEDELNIVMISALFHDAGYTFSNDNHEEESTCIAAGFLQSCQIGEPGTGEVIRAIMATKVPQQPDGIVSEVLCDADLMHLAGDDYFEQMELLRIEWQKTGRYDLTEYQFHLNSIDFFKRHHFHTHYGKTVLQAKKEETMVRILERIARLPG